MVTRKQQGFTIIEVVLVLAIAGLIFLMVFIALPALQRGQRDTSRRSSLSTFTAQVTQFQSNNKGAVPTTANIDTFITKYMQSNWVDPTSNAPYAKAGSDGAVDNATTPGTWFYSDGYVCNGEAITNAAGSGAGGRTFAVRMKLEGAGVACMDNK